MKYVSIHAPAWGATASNREEKGDKMFQSTLPRGERLEEGKPGRPAARVSIHAPAWGATTGGIALRNNDNVSIHAPAWGATSKFKILKRQTKVSIHAPAWGATFTI